MKAAVSLVLLPFLLLYPGEAAGRLQSWIIGGREAKPHSRPYMVSLQRKGQHVCGGALVHTRWVLTAAHCQLSRNKGPLKAVVGLHSLDEASPHQQSFSIARSVPHPGYQRKTMEHDLMLLKLDRKVKSRQTKPLALPKKAWGAGAQCSVAGWGLTEDGELSPVLKELDVRVLDGRMCNGSRFWHGELTPTMTCYQAVAKHSGPCKGDSGGPVVCGKKAEAAGVISFSDTRCINVFKPPVATAVFPYRAWIQKVLKS